jgi:molybdopterin molybdotransferase
MKQSDFIIFSGGISVGDYDYVRPILQREKVKTIFYKVQQKPGKPLYFGIKDKRYIFGLPGNPASVLTCYYEYVRPAIRKNMGYPQPLPIALTLPVTVDIRKKPGLTHFLKAVTDFHTVTPLPGQESYVMTPFVKANCFIIVPPEITFAEKGSPVTVHLF